MFQKLYYELSEMGWKYHMLENVDDDGIRFRAISLEPNGVNEVIRIKEIADRFRFHMKWDGENIRIVRTET